MEISVHKLAGSPTEQLISKTFWNWIISPAMETVCRKKQWSMLPDEERTFVSCAFKQNLFTKMSKKNEEFKLLLAEKNWFSFFHQR